MATSSSSKMRAALRDAGAAIGKIAVALGVYAGIMFGWQSLQASQRPRYNPAAPLPNEVAQDDCAVWFVGSSSMSRWTSLQQDMRPWSTHNRAIAGASLSEINTRFLNDEKPKPPRAIVFYAGENDLAFGVDPKVAVGGFEAFLRNKWERLGAVPVFFVSVKPSPTRWANFPAQTTYNRGVRALIARHPDLHYVDLTSRFLVNGRPGPFYGPDDLHLNDRGYAIFASGLLAALTSGLPRSVVHTCHADRAET